MGVEPTFYALRERWLTAELTRWLSFCPLSRVYVCLYNISPGIASNRRSQTWQRMGNIISAPDVTHFAKLVVGKWPMNPGMLQLGIASAKVQAFAMP